MADFDKSTFDPKGCSGSQKKGTGSDGTEAGGWGKG